MLLTTKLDQRLVMNQQLRQAITLLQYNTLDLQQIVKQHLENNPLIELEETESDEEEQFLIEDAQEEYLVNNISADIVKSKEYHEDDSILENVSNVKTLREHLLEQTLLCQFDQAQQSIAIAIIDAIDESGRLTMSLEEVQAALSIEQDRPSIEILNSVLKKIQTFDPIGIAARDLKECLLIQLEFLPEKNVTWKHAKMILQALNESGFNNKKMMKELRLEQNDFANAMSLIRSLNPTPGANFFQENNINIEPELYVKKIKNTWRVFLTKSILTGVRINNEYKNLLKNTKKEEGSDALNQVLQEAQWLLKGLKRRNETLLNVGTYIVELQKEFLEKGQAFMKPLNIIDVSHALNLHESTVSRITSGKYIATPRGVFELKYFFPSQVSTQTGDGCSAIAVKALIKNILDEESKGGNIFSDSDIADALKQKGINIARRTVAKYREAMKILPSYQRAQIKWREPSI